MRRIAIAGYGPVGRALAPLLSSRGDAARIVQRRPPVGLSAQTEFIEADLEDQAQARLACADVDTVVCAIGIPYRSSIYIRVWPIVMRNLLDGCARSAARFVFADSLYMYGPQTHPLNEDVALTDFGQKPRVRAKW